MTNLQDPPRLFESSGLDDELQRALYDAAHDAPSPQQLQTMLSALPGAPAPGALSTHSKVFGKLFLVKWGGALLLSAGALMWGSSSLPNGQATPAEHMQSAPSAAADARPLGAASALPGPEHQPVLGARESDNKLSDPLVASEAEDQPADARGRTAPLEKTSAVVSDGVLAAAQAAPDATQQKAAPGGVSTRVDAPPVNSASVAARPASRKSQVVHSTAEREAKSAAALQRHPTALHQEAAGMSELELLDQAQRALRQQPQRALQLLESHRERFPHGAFAEEREALQIDAFVSLGRNAEVRRLARQFLARFPASLHRQRIEALCQP